MTADKKGCGSGHFALLWNAIDLKNHTWWRAGGTCSWSVRGHSGAPQGLLAVPCSPAAVSGYAWKSIINISATIKIFSKSIFLQCKHMLGSSRIISFEGLHTSARHASSTAPWLYLLPSTISHQSCDAEFNFELRSKHINTGVGYVICITMQTETGNFLSI